MESVSLESSSVDQGPLFTTCWRHLRWQSSTLGVAVFSTPVDGCCAEAISHSRCDPRARGGMLVADVTTPMLEVPFALLGMNVFMGFFFLDDCVVPVVFVFLLDFVLVAHCVLYVLARDHGNCTMCRNEGAEWGEGSMLAPNFFSEFQRCEAELGSELNGNSLTEVRPEQLNTVILNGRNNWILQVSKARLEPSRRPDEHGRKTCKLGRVLIDNPLIGSYVHENLQTTIHSRRYIQKKRHFHTLCTAHMASTQPQHTAQNHRAHVHRSNILRFPFACGHSPMSSNTDTTLPAARVSTVW